VPRGGRLCCAGRCGALFAGDHGIEPGAALDRQWRANAARCRRQAHGAALDTLKKFGILIRHAINIGWLKHDPSLGIKRSKIKKIRSWTDDEIEQFKKRRPLGTRQRTAFHLFLNLGQRRSDVVRMAQTHISQSARSG
jgi:integrase